MFNKLSAVWLVVFVVLFSSLVLTGLYDLGVRETAAGPSHYWWVPAAFVWLVVGVIGAVIRLASELWRE